MRWDDEDYLAKAECVNIPGILILARTEPGE